MERPAHPGPSHDHRAKRSPAGTSSADRGCSHGLGRPAESMPSAWIRDQVVRNSGIVEGLGEAGLCSLVHLQVLAVS